MVNIIALTIFLFIILIVYMINDKKTESNRLSEIEERGKRISNDYETQMSDGQNKKMFVKNKIRTLEIESIKVNNRKEIAKSFSHIIYGGLSIGLIYITILVTVFQGKLYEADLEYINQLFNLIMLVGMIYTLFYGTYVIYLLDKLSEYAERAKILRDMID